MTDVEARVRRYYQLIDDGDIDALIELFAEDVTYHRPGQAPIDGRDDLEYFYREQRPLSDGSHEVVSVLVDGDRVAVRGRFSGRQGDVEVAFGFADFHEFEGAVIADRFTYTDRDTV